jgi:hypothetical protein
LESGTSSSAKQHFSRLFLPPLRGGLAVVRAQKEDEENRFDVKSLFNLTLFCSTGSLACACF